MLYFDQIEKIIEDVDEFVLKTYTYNFKSFLKDSRSYKKFSALEGYSRFCSHIVFMDGYTEYEGHENKIYKFRTEFQATRKDIFYLIDETGLSSAFMLGPAYNSWENDVYGYHDNNVYVKDCLVYPEGHDNYCDLAIFKKNFLPLDKSRFIHAFNPEIIDFIVPDNRASPIIYRNKSHCVFLPILELLKFQNGDSAYINSTQILDEYIEVIFSTSSQSRSSRSTYTYSAKIRYIDFELIDINLLEKDFYSL